MFEILVIVCVILILFVFYVLFSTWNGETKQEKIDEEIIIPKVPRQVRPTVSPSPATPPKRAQEIVVNHFHNTPRTSFGNSPSSSSFHSQNNPTIVPSHVSDSSYEDDRRKDYSTSFDISDSFSSSCGPSPSSDCGSSDSGGCCSD